jgi:hypothetical protein
MNAASGTGLFDGASLMARQTDTSSQRAVPAGIEAACGLRHRLGSGLALGALAVVALPAIAAQAADRPATLPSRDVDVTYRVMAPGSAGPAADASSTPALSQRLRYLAASGLLRVDPPGGRMFLIMDYHKRTLAMVEPAVRRVLDLPAPPGMPFAGTEPTAHFERQGAETIAGLACTDWLTTDAADHPTRACLTQDGVLLRAESGGHVLAEAVSVNYAAQNPADFEVPAGFEHAAQGK